MNFLTDKSTWAMVLRLIVVACLAIAGELTKASPLPDVVVQSVKGVGADPATFSPAALGWIFQLIAASGAIWEILAKIFPNLVKPPTPAPAAVTSLYGSRWAITPTDAGRTAYEAYCQSTDGKSLVSGAQLPGWDDVTPPMRNAWIHAALAVRGA